PHTRPHRAGPALRVPDRQRLPGRRGLQLGRALRLRGHGDAERRFQRHRRDGPGNRYLLRDAQPGHRLGAGLRGPTDQAGGERMSENKQSARSREVMRQLRRLTYDHLALAGLIMLGAMAFLAVFAPYLTPYPKEAG